MEPHRPSSPSAQRKRHANAFTKTLRKLFREQGPLRSRDVVRNGKMPLGQTYLPTSNLDAFLEDPSYPQIEPSIVGQLPFTDSLTPNLQSETRIHGTTRMNNPKWPSTYGAELAQSGTRWKELILRKRPHTATRSGAEPLIFSGSGVVDGHVPKPTHRTLAGWSRKTVPHDSPLLGGDMFGQRVSSDENKIDGHPPHHNEQALRAPHEDETDAIGTRSDSINFAGHGSVPGISPGELWPDHDSCHPFLRFTQSSNNVSHQETHSTNGKDTRMKHRESSAHRNELAESSSGAARKAWDSDRLGEVDIISGSCNVLKPVHLHFPAAAQSFHLVQPRPLHPRSRRVDDYDIESEQQSGLSAGREEAILVDEWTRIKQGAKEKYVEWISRTPIQGTLESDAEKGRNDTANKQGQRVDCSRAHEMLSPLQQLQLMSDDRVDQLQLRRPNALGIHTIGEQGEQSTLDPYELEKRLSTLIPSFSSDPPNIVPRKRARITPDTRTSRGLADKLLIDDHETDKTSKDLKKESQQQEEGADGDDFMEDRSLLHFRMIPRAAAVKDRDASADTAEPRTEQPLHTENKSELIKSKDAARGFPHALPTFLPSSAVLNERHRLDAGATQEIASKLEPTSARIGDQCQHTFSGAVEDLCDSNSASLALSLSQTHVELLDRVDHWRERVAGIDRRERYAASATATYPSTLNGLHIVNLSEHMTDDFLASLSQRVALNATSSQNIPHKESQTGLEQSADFNSEEVHRRRVVYPVPPPYPVRSSVSGSPNDLAKLFGKSISLTNGNKETRIRSLSSPQATTAPAHFPSHTRKRCSHEKRLIDLASSQDLSALSLPPGSSFGTRHIRKLSESDSRRIFGLPKSHTFQPSAAAQPTSSLPDEHSDRSARVEALQLWKLVNVKSQDGRTTVRTVQLSYFEELCEFLRRNPKLLNVLATDHFSMKREDNDSEEGEETSQGLIRCAQDSLPWQVPRQDETVTSVQEETGGSSRRDRATSMGEKMHETERSRDVNGNNRPALSDEGSENARVELTLQKLFNHAEGRGDMSQCLQILADLHQEIAARSFSTSEQSAIHTRLANLERAIFIPA